MTLEDALKRIEDLERRVRELEATTGRIDVLPAYPQFPSTDPTQWPPNTVICGNDWSAPGK